MVNKCSVGRSKTNYVGHDTDAVFSFPKGPDLFGRFVIGLIGNQLISLEFALNMIRL